MRAGTTGIVCRLLLAIVAAWGTAANLPAAELDPAEVLRLVSAQLRAIRSIELEYKTYYQELDGPGVQVADGLGLFSTWSWGMDRSSTAQYQHGKHVLDYRELPSVRKFVYHEEFYAWDGQVLHSFTPLTKTGAIRRDEPGVFEKWQGPLHLINLQTVIDGQHVDLRELLVDPSRAWRVERLADSKLWRLTLPVAGVAKPTTVREYFGARELVVIADGARNFVPTGLTVRNLNTRDVLFETAVDEFYEAAPGIWVPISGSRLLNQVVESMPTDVTHQEFDSLDLENQIEIARGSIEIKPAYMGRELFRVDKKSVRVNQPIDRSRFAIAFPDGSSIWDNVAKKELVFGAAWTPNPPELPQAADWVWIAHLAAILSLVALLATAILTRRRAERNALAATGPPSPSPFGRGLG